MKRAVLPSVLLLASLFVTCQETEVKVNGNISGIVKDKQTARPIDHCAVAINPGNKQVYTSGSGEFQFTDVTMGEYTISFSKAGYNSYSRKIIVEADKTVQADALLEPAIAPVVNTVTADNIQFTQATLHGIVAKKGEASLKECGFYYGTTESMDKKYICQGAETEFQATIQDLADGTLYYYQAYSVNSIGEGKGEVKTFETKALIPAQVQTKNATDITTTQASLNGTITSKGNSDITECGFYFGATENPEQKYEVVYESDNFSITVTDLTDGATYYYCAYAVNAKGEVRGEVISLNAQTALAPTVKTGEATGVELYEVVLNGEIISDGGASVTECGFYFGNSVNPTQKYPVINVENGLMSRAMTELSEGTTYYYLAYAINAKGESKGDEKSFTTIPIIIPEVTTHEVKDVTETTAKVSGRLNSTGRSSKLKVGFVYDTADGAELGKCLGFTADIASDTTTAFEKTISGLTKGTTYYARAYATNEKGTVYGDAVEFTTIGPTLPKVETNAVSNVTTTTVRFNGKISSIGERVTGIEDYGFVWSTTSEPKLATGEKTSNGPRTNTTTYYNDVTGLNDGTTYYVRAYATNEKGTAYGSEVKFTTTEILIPTVEVYNVDDIKTTSAGLIGRVKTFGTGKNISDYGFVMSTSPNPTLEDGNMYSMGMATKLDNIYYYYDGSSAGKYRYNVSGLIDGTTYYVRAYATNEKGTSYSEDFEFKTTAIVVPKVEVYDVTETGTTKSSFIGLVKSFGNAANISDYGFVWSTSPNPTLETGTSVSNGFVTKIDNIYYYYDGSSAGKYRNNVSGLQDGTIYYVRAYATNEKGTGYSEDFEFKTVEIVAPKVEVYDVTDISTTTSRFIGRINSFGNADGISDYGFVWSTTPEPTLSDTTKSYSYGRATKLDNIYYFYDGSSTGKYALDVSSLTDGTTYYVRAYATNEKGTGYSKDYEFTTIEIVPPTLEVSNVDEIKTTSAKLHGVLKSYGNASKISEYGFVYGTTPHPTLETGETIKSSSLNYRDEYAELLSDLTDGTKYYVRAYATNEKGTGYSKDYEFTTTEIVIPTVEVTNVDEIKTTSAKLHGGIKSYGNASKIIEYGFIYGTTPHPTIETGTTIKSSSLNYRDEYSEVLSDLTHGTTYYVRAYATNEKGTGYSEDFNFTTISIVVPKIEMTDVTNISTNGAKLNGKMISFGNSKRITDYGFVYSTSHDPTLETGVKSSMGASTASTYTWNYNSEVSDLTDGTTYYVCAYATNEAGTGYSDEFVFTTLEIVLPTVKITSVSSIDTKSARLYGTMVSFGRATRISDYGFVWDTIPKPTLETGMHVSKGSSTSSTYTWNFNSDISGLKDGTKYYARAYAINEKGTGYDNDDYEFTTVEILIPTVKISSLNGITTSSVSLRGQITNKGNASLLTDYGFVLDTIPAPTLEKSLVVSNGPLTVGTDYGNEVTGLESGTTYYVRAYATNEKGTGYGDEYSFTTKSK